MEYTLKRGALAARVTTAGGELISLRDGGGTEYIWQGDPASWTGRNPILFPIVGALVNETIRFGGREYHMKQHGFARRSEFTLEEQGEDYAVLGLRESEATLAQYPFPFHFRVRHQLTEEGFATSFMVENTGDGPMPFCVGAHTAFRCPLDPGETFEDYQLVFDREGTADTLLLDERGHYTGRRERWIEESGTLRLQHRMFDLLDTLVFEGLRSTGVRLVHPGTGRGVYVRFEGFPMIAFWTKPEASAPYLCIEPWHGCGAYVDESGEFTGKPHVITLAPGEERTLTYTVSLLSPHK